eukprot:scaffold57899_cov18-Tisochrysis_lutea.AAC.3
MHCRCAQDSPSPSPNPRKPLHRAVPSPPCPPSLLAPCFVVVMDALGGMSSSVIIDCLLNVEHCACDNIRRWHAAQYLPIDEDVFVGGKVGGLTAGEEEEEEEEELAAASYYDNYMGSAAEGAFYGEEEQEG